MEPGNGERSAADTTVPPMGATTSPPPDERPASAKHAPRIGGYQLVRELGRGGQAVVYEGVQNSTTRRVAIKVLTAGRYASDAEQRRLAREAQVLASVDHPNVVQVIDLGTTPDGFPY